MGIPKFFRWISERYPLTSQLITPNSIPTFDNLYLDMNGIIHNCSHPPSSEGDIHFRISEEQMILAIFAYIDHLFTKIKPQKVFFMAIDGVAPRAKMNQQRSRRFRTAKDTREQRIAAEKKGETLPEEKAFDSNCITPGTPFMARLSNHLKYYVSKRISEDAEWRNVKVILSGHDVPGEGEHKIQEFIRLSKAQPDYNADTRHCLYGLDADLIMLGLLSHDPHFCLLREEVTFGRKTKKSTGLANANFYLLHISLLREYLDLEFISLKEQIPFEYDLERIIDDFILMGIFVGNDFLPHLPDLHINEGALERIWTIYKSILPTAGGYMNEHGTISLPRLQMMLDRLADFEIERFEEEFADQNWYKGRQTKQIEAMEKARKRGKLIITKDQKKIFDDVKAFVLKHQSKPSHRDRISIVNKLSARDTRFLQELADSLHLRATWDESDDYGQNLVVLSFDMEGISDDGASVGKSDEEKDSEWESEAGFEAEGDIALNRVFGKYEKAKVVENTTDDFEETYEATMKQKMDDWKTHYYKDKLEINTHDESQLDTLVFRYVEGLQWVLNYYYKGCSSWAWFYDYHFAPRLTDLRKVAEMKFDFQLGTPFTPFQQLMGVLPEDSKEHVPAAYRDLMTEETSPIHDFYPKEFELDMNGKKQDWEAVVKIPFIDQQRLLKAMAPRDARLTDEEKRRNQSGVLSTQFTYDENCDEHYPSSQPGFFPDLAHSRARASPFNLPTLGDGIDLILGLIKGVSIGAGALAGFPSLHTLPHNGALGYHGVSVFQSDSRNQSMVITITSNKGERGTSEQVAAQYIGNRVFTTWPYLHEGMVVGVSDDMFKYERANFGKSSKIVAHPHNPFAAIAGKKQADQVEHHYSKRFGVITGHIDRLLHVRPLKGLKRLDTGALVKDYEGPDQEITIALQMAVSEITYEDERYIEQPAPPIHEEFPIGERVLFLGQMAYGGAAQVTSTAGGSLGISLAYFSSEGQENKVFSDLVAYRPSGHYYPSHILSRRLGLSGLQLSKICSTLMVRLENDSKVNIGIPMKFESKGLKVLGYTRRADRGWEYSETAARALERYRAAFPEAFNNLGAGGEGLVRSAELCPTAEDPDKVIKDMKKWLTNEGLADLDAVSLFAEKLEGDVVKKIEEIADKFASQKTHDSIKRAAINGIPRQAVMKPSHAIHRLNGQEFRLGDRVVMAQDSASGGVPLGMKGVVVGISTKDIDIIWDRPFMGGETLGGRCSEYRGSVAPFSTCLNLTRPQFVVDPSAANGQQSQQANRGQFTPQFGPRPNVAPKNYQPSIPSNRPVSAVKNPHSKPHAQASNDLPYGHAAKGMRPQQAPAPAPTSHQAKLQTALLGHKAPAAHGHGHAHAHVASRPAPLSPKSPTKILHGLPHTNGHPGGDAPRGARGGRGGPGGFRGRGRGRGRGGAVVPVQNGQ